MRFFLTSDTHFNHTALEDYENRPCNFSDIIVDNWNKLVTNDDVVVHLGDVCFGPLDVWYQYVPHLQGRKILVKGNHDKKGYSWYLDHGFDFVCDDFTWTIYGMKLLFTHEPVSVDESPPFDLNIHGHCHTKVRENDSRNTSNFHRLFALEHTNYEPVLLKTFLKK